MGGNGQYRPPAGNLAFHRPPDPGIGYGCGGASRCIAGYFPG